MNFIEKAKEAFAKPQVAVLAAEPGKPGGGETQPVDPNKKRINQAKATLKAKFFKKNNEGQPGTN